MKSLKKALAILLSVVMLSSGMVFVMPQSVAATYPNNLYNGTTKVNYTSTDAANGKYLVEIDMVKYNPNISVAPGAIRSEAGDITVTYRPDNGTAPVVTQRFEDAVAANAFNYEGEGTLSYYAVLEGFPQKATASIKKTNTAENNSGIYTVLKIWNSELGMFEGIFDFTKIERSNGLDTAGLMFTNIESLIQYYPYAKQGTTSGSNLTLPSGLDATSAAQTFSVTDQWGVTMTAPKITYTSVAGLTFSQNKNVMTVKGTGDANNPNGNSRTVSLTATYETRNSSVANTYSITRTFTVYNSSILTYAPTYANREKAGLSVSFKTSDSNSVDQFPLNSSYQATTTNYVVLKNNASRTVTVNLSTTSGDKFRISPATDTIQAGASKSFQLIDLKAATGNYNADITVNYTIDGFYNASSGTLVNLTAGGTIPFVYNKVTVPTVKLDDDNTWPSYDVDVQVTYVSSAGILNQTYSKSDGNMSYLNANFYIDTDKYPTYNSAGLGFKFEPDSQSDYWFQPDENDAGYYVQQGDYDSPGTFGFSANPSTHTSRYQEKVKIKITGGKTVPFYGTIFKGSTTKNSPAEIYFDGDQNNDDGLDILLDRGADNSCYLNSHLYVYAYSKNDLRSTLQAQGGLLSCYYQDDQWTDYGSMGNSKLRNAQIQLGTDMTSQYNITQAKNALTTARTTLLAATKNATYCLNHNKHTGDITGAIEQTAVDYYLFEIGSTHVLNFNAAFATDRIKHSDSYAPHVTASGTYDYSYDYWDIDFTDLIATLENYDRVAPAGQFINESDAVGKELLAARNVDTTSATALPEKQTDVDNIINALNDAMRDLVYTSYDMSVTHTMYNPIGTQIIENEIIQPFTETYNKTTTYGAVVDGTVNLADGSYTVKGFHYEPQPDPTFLEYASGYYAQGVSSEYVCQEDKEIFIVYHAKSIQDTTLKDYIADIEDHIDEWDGRYTEVSIDRFVDWFDENDRDGTFSKIFSIFDQEEYNALLEEFMAEYNKLDTIATEEQISNVEQFMFDYEMLTDFSDAFCHASEYLTQYADAYEQAQQIEEWSESSNAGKNETAAFLEGVQAFTLTYHTEGAHHVMNTPLDGIDGSYYGVCSNCSAVIESGTLASPRFNTYQHPAYNYANRGASLRVESEDVQSTTQGMRFAASCKVPAGATVTDFGYVYTQTKYLNGGIEPTDNRVVNVSLLVDGGVNVHKASLKNGNYSVYTEDGQDVYTFNLVLNLEKQNWAVHYAARSYITYELNGVSVTVYDATYASRTAADIAEQVIANPMELPIVREYIAAKFAL